MQAEIVLLPGDGIGPEVVAAGKAILSAVARAYGHTFHFQPHLLGGCAIDRFANALPALTLQGCQQADAILLGAVGGPKWDDPNAAVRPEQGLLGLRKNLKLYANLRPVQPYPALFNSSPLKRSRLDGVDLLLVRELTGGIYFGEPRQRHVVEGITQAVDTMVYNQDEITRVAHIAFRLARRRRKKVTSIDKANVLECSRLWRQTVNEVALEYPDITLEHILVDAAAMYLINRPAEFDVLLTANMFGDILTDEASVLTGSMGTLPSASLGAEQNSVNLPRGLYEPIHGSAPDIAGKGIANPTGTILSTALLLRHSLGLEDEAHQVEKAVETVIAAGKHTPDIAAPGETPLTTTEFTRQILAALQAPERSTIG